MIYSAYKLNKQDDSIQPWWTPFPIWNQPVVSCLLLTVASWPAYRFLRSLVRWSGIPISWRIFQFVVIHTVKGFSEVSEIEVDIYMEFCWSNRCWQFDLWSSAFSKSDLYIWKFSDHILWNLVWRILSITLPACEMSTVVWWFELSLALPFFGIAMKTDLFQSCGHCWVFQILLPYWAWYFNSIIF